MRAGQQVQVVCARIQTLESRETETVCTSLEPTPLYCHVTSHVKMSDPHTYINTHTPRKWLEQALGPAASNALHLLVYILLQLELLTGILRGPVLQLPETEDERLNKMQFPAMIAINNHVYAVS